MDYQPGVHAGVIAVVVVFGKEVGWFYFYICFWISAQTMSSFFVVLLPLLSVKRTIRGMYSVKNGSLCIDEKDSPGHWGRGEDCGICQEI